MVRTIAGRKQTDVANKLSISPSLLSMFEKGRREPSISFLFEFCKHFNISLDQFFFGLDNSDSNNSESHNIYESIASELKNVVSNLEKILLAHPQNAKNT